MVAQHRNKTGATTPPTSPDQSSGIELILGVSREEYGQIPSGLEKLLTDVEDLYAGRWPSHEACEVEYHDFVHALDVALAAARIVAGWNRVHPERRIDEELYCWTVAAGLFHDAGYIKDKGDREGQGGKFTITHVQRSMNIAEGYLRRTNWPQRATIFVPAVIALTDYRQQSLNYAVFINEQELLAARILPTADLIGQIGDSRYAEKIDGLFAELQEMYFHLNRDKPAPAQPVPVYNSAQELRNTTEDFYENFVAPRLAEFGHLEQYLDVYFGHNRNPYRENIACNLARHCNPRLADQS